MHTEITQRINAAHNLALKGIIASQEREIARLRAALRESDAPERDYSLGGDEFVDPTTGRDTWHS